VRAPARSTAQGSLAARFAARLLVPVRVEVTTSARLAVLTGAVGPVPTRAGAAVISVAPAIVVPPAGMTDAAAITVGVAVRIATACCIASAVLVAVAARHTIPVAGAATIAPTITIAPAIPSVSIAAAAAQVW